MTKVTLADQYNGDPEVSAGDLIVCNDDSKWVLIMLDNNDFMLYELSTHRYKMLTQDYIVGHLKDKEKYVQGYVPLSVINSLLTKRFLSPDGMQPRVIESKNLIINLVEVK